MRDHDDQPREYAFDFDDRSGSLEATVAVMPFNLDLNQNMPALSNMNNGVREIVRALNVRCA